jgi:hypothetical protein
MFNDKKGKEIIQAGEGIDIGKRRKNIRKNY